MLIGELADHVGVNPKTVRYHESIGLLPEPARTAPAAATTPPRTSSGSRSSVAPPSST